MSNLPEKYAILAVETSCDETSAAVTVGRKVVSNIIWSQIKVHKPWGGVVPNLARREHEKHLPGVIKQAIKQANINRKRFNLSDQEITLDTIDSLAVVYGPGLAIALEVGIKQVKELAQKHYKPVLAVNHMEGHLLSSFALNLKGNGPFGEISPEFPILGLLVSGGHTQLVLMKDFGDYELLGETLDDAAGEAFDKIAKMLDLGYPGGPIIEELARKGNPKRFDLPIPMAKHKSLNFSFSGLKTACLYKLREIPDDEKDKQLYRDFAAAFQHALIESIIIKLKQAIKKSQPNQIVLGGGVINNIALRSRVRETASKHNLPVFFPYSDKLLSDNGGMVGIAAYYSARQGDFVDDINQLDRLPNLSFE